MESSEPEKRRRLSAGSRCHAGCRAKGHEWNNKKHVGVAEETRVNLGADNQGSDLSEMR